MKAYLQLQFKMMNRKFKELGLEPIFAYLLLLSAFIVFSIFIFERTEFAKYIYLLLALFFIGKLSEIQRNDFLKLAFGDKKKNKIRIMENFLISLPFAIFLVYRQEFLFSGVLILLTIVLALLNYKANLSFVIPTPFSKEPFEFCLGFRNTFYLYFIAYGLTIISILVENFNLGVFAMLLMFYTTLLYYSKPEKEYFVWNFGQNAQEFLFAKIKTAIKFSSFSVAPVFIALLIFDYNKIGLLALFLIIGFALLVFMILAKYANYPEEFSFTQAIFLMISIMFPPILIFLIPYFYNKSTKQLSILLK